MTKFEVPDMSCGHCKSTIERSILAVDPNASVEIDLASRVVVVGSAVPVANVIAAMKAAGYEATVVP